MTQNRSHAVMAQRHEPHDSLDFFPTPPWATRALAEHVIIGNGERRDTIAKQTVHEPAAGAGDMVKPLSEYFAKVWASDVRDHGGIGLPLHDFLMPGKPFCRPDWVITNPPFRLAAEFIWRGLEVSKVGVAMLVRTSFIEGLERYKSLFKVKRPTIFAPFVERVPMVKGRLDPAASTATAYCWMVWQHRPVHHLETIVCWIPPCRKQLTRAGDYPEVAE